MEMKRPQYAWKEIYGDATKEKTDATDMDQRKALENIMDIVDLEPKKEEPEPELCPCGNDWADCNRYSSFSNYKALTGKDNVEPNRVAYWRHMFGA